MTSTTSADAAQTTHRPRRAWAAVVALTIVGTLNYADRNLPSVLAEPIRVELSLSDTALGVINGFGFLAVYAVIGIPISRFSDRGAFGAVTSVCLAFWGVMTMAGGAAQSGAQLALTRLGVAVGEAGSMPAAHAYVGRNFIPSRRSLPLAVLTLAVPFASVVGLLGGGLLAGALGWRITFVVMGGASVALVPVVLAIVGRRQPLDGAARAARAPLNEVAAIVRRPSYVLIVAGSGCISVAGYSIAVFGPAFLMRVRGMALDHMAVHYGIASSVAGVVSLLAVGRLADRLSRRDPRWLLWLVAMTVGVLLPFAVAGFVVGDGSVAAVCVALGYAVGTAYMAPSIAAIQRLVTAEQRATASAIFLFVSATAGSVGPLLTGVLSDVLPWGTASLGYALLLVVPAVQVVAIVLYLLASRRFAAETVEASEADVS